MTADTSFRAEEVWQAEDVTAHPSDPVLSADPALSFVDRFFSHLAGIRIRNLTYLEYLATPAARRSNDERPVVDTVIVAPLLGALGYSEGERVYDRQRQADKPDFAPEVPGFGTCFVVEDKNTTLTLDLDLSDPDSHLSQLKRYIKYTPSRLGLLTNGKRLTLWQFDHSETQPTLDIDVQAALAVYLSGGLLNMPPDILAPFKSLHDLCSRATFTDTERLEQLLSSDEIDWLTQAASLAHDEGAEAQLVAVIKVLIEDLQRDALRTLDGHLSRAEQYRSRISVLSDDPQTPTKQRLEQGKSKVLRELENYQVLLLLSDTDREQLQESFSVYENHPELTPRLSTLQKDILQRSNISPQRTGKNAPKKLKNLREVPGLEESLSSFARLTSDIRSHQISLRKEFKEALAVADDYLAWSTLLNETMLGELDDNHRRSEFALQTAYVVLIRLLLIRVCEDKGVFQERFISNGGIKFWQDNIKRYLQFVQGNPYDPLLDMAYKNAQNIYAHFFTGRELFNWYRLDRHRLVVSLIRLNQFNFEKVDSDVIGTVFATYFGRDEKKSKGQYYTPKPIVEFILDEIGYVEGPKIIGPNKRLIDPACGSGTFLVTAAQRLVASYKASNMVERDPQSVLRRVQESLFAFDLNPFACYLAEVNLLIQVLDLVTAAHAKGQRPQLQRFHVYNTDSLELPRDNIQLSADESGEQEEVNRIKSREANHTYFSGFPYVVANPPYGAELSVNYKKQLEKDWPIVWEGKPDTYVFFIQLGLKLLSKDGKMGYITPNTYLTGTNTKKVRKSLLDTTLVTQIVDLPQNIWPDAAVDCALLFVQAENDDQKRKENIVSVNILASKGKLDSLISRDWQHTLNHKQSAWMASGNYVFDLRRDDLLDAIEQVCALPNGRGKIDSVQRLTDIAEISQGIIVNGERVEGDGPHIMSTSTGGPPPAGWVKLLDKDSSLKRYSLRWGKDRKYLHYGPHLHRPRPQRFFTQPKLIFIRLMNKAVKRRLIAVYDDQEFYNRDNFNVVTSLPNGKYPLKSILAIVNSALMNYWYTQKNNNVNINPASLKTLPIVALDDETHLQLGQLVDQITDLTAEIVAFEDQGYIIRPQYILVPISETLKLLRQSGHTYNELKMFDVVAMGNIVIPSTMNNEHTLSGNIFVSKNHPQSLVLRNDQLWIDIPDDDLRAYTERLLTQTVFRGATLQEVLDRAMLPADTQALQEFNRTENALKDAVLLLRERAEVIDHEIDELIFKLYKIEDRKDQERILNSVRNNQGDIDETEQSDLDVTVDGIDVDEEEPEGIVSIFD
ncbi:N-6 DNA methylase [Deinococcus altitudinis]|uniref:N-6 DNA methylase n=1 Tax=Deinococcus altitudinis TaxID=468914 RepID=UPI0038916464